MLADARYSPAAGSTFDSQYNPPSRNRPDTCGLQVERAVLTVLVTTSGTNSGRTAVITVLVTTCNTWHSAGPQVFLAANCLQQQQNPTQLWKSRLLTLSEAVPEHPLRRWDTLPAHPPAANSCLASPLASPGRKNASWGPGPTAPTTACRACSAACRSALLPLPAAATSCSAAARQLLMSIPARGAVAGCCSGAPRCC
jgi:hypothetical protein